MSTPSKKRAFRSPYVSQSQLVIEGFETSFSQNLDANNRWVKLAGLIPWDELANLYLKKNPIKPTGRPPLNPRVVLGALIIKHLCNLDDRETISQITENIYMQYFLGYSGFTQESPFDASLFVEIRKRLGDDLLAEMNLRIIQLSNQEAKDKKSSNKPGQDKGQGNGPTHKGILLMDATVSPQDIAYPTDLRLLNEARVITEKVIDHLHEPGKVKPRTYRRIARKSYLQVAQNKQPGRKSVRKAVGKQLRFLKRNIGHINRMLDEAPTFSLPFKLQKQLLVVQTIYGQQLEMYQERKHSIPDRIVSLHQPHVRPMVRGKLRAKVEFGSKLHLSLVDGFAFIDTISWDAFNEGSHLSEYIENYKDRFGFYPEKVLVDKLYCTRENRKWLKERHIKLAAKPLGRPSAKAVANHVSPGERNPIEGKFGQAKNAYGMGRIRARLRQTSQTWIASIILVLNLVKLTGQASYWLSFSARGSWIDWLLFSLITSIKLRLCKLVQKLINKPDYDLLYG